MTTFALDLDSLARTTALCTGSVVSWRDADVPLHERGVSLGWLYDFVRSVDRSWQDVVRNHERASRASFHFDHVPEPDPLPFAETVEMTPAFLVPNVIRPLTAIIKGPLFALVPAEHRGRPDLFVSHSWSNPLTTGSAFSTLAALASPFGGGPVKRVWLDVACYNQHRVESIAADMESVVASIGQVGLPMINAVPFTRLWCLWELLCAYTAKAGVAVFEANGSAYDIGFLRQRFDEGFKSVERAATTLPGDREQILDAMVSTFGSIRQADRYVRELVIGMLSKDSDKPWNSKAAKGQRSADR